MGNKKKIGKNIPQVQDSAEPKQTFLGTDVKALGIAIGSAVATAVVGEITQLAISKVTKAIEGNHTDSNSSESSSRDSKIEQAQHAFSDAKTSVKSTLADATPLKNAVDTIKEVVEEVKPSLTRIVESVIEASLAGKPLKEALSAVGQAGDVAEDRMADAAGAIKKSTETVSLPLQAAAEDVSYDMKKTLNSMKKSGKKNKKKSKKSGKKNKLAAAVKA